MNNAHLSAPNLVGARVFFDTDAALSKRLTAVFKGQRGATLTLSANNRPTNAKVTQYLRACTGYDEFVLHRAPVKRGAWVVEAVA